MRRGIHTAVLILCAMGIAADEPGLQLQAPDWVNPADGFDATLSADFALSPDAVRATVKYAGAEPIDAEVSAGEDSRRVRLAVPGAASWGYGPAEVRVRIDAHDGPIVRSFAVPASFFKDIDVTGPAAVPLLHPLPDETAEVRYIPCCNIYGGQTLAERIPSNPMENEQGLPTELISDFVVLEPDGLSASTMGLYFDFRFDDPDLPMDRIALYEWTGRDWQEVFDYDVDPETGTVSFHCPDGGTFVVGLRDESPA